MKQPHVWLVEIKDSGRWLPSIGIGLVRPDTRRVLNEWLINLPDDKLRLAKYIRAKGDK